MWYISSGMGDRFGVQVVSLMALQLAIVDRNPFRPCLLSFSCSDVRASRGHLFYFLLFSCQGMSWTSMEVALPERNLPFQCA